MNSIRNHATSDGQIGDPRKVVIKDVSNETNKPIINPASEQLLLAIIDNLPQSLIITGAPRLGLSTIARYISELLQITPIIILPEKDEKIDIDKGVISVGLMRRLYNDTRTINNSQRIIIIDYAERMTVQSQNAFLKLLEEPSDNLYFILVTHSTAKLLPTILSRLEKLAIKPITTDQSNILIDSLGVTDKTKRSQLLFMADGLPAELTQLMADDEYFNKRQTMVRDAREIIQANLYQKLLLAHKYKDNRNDALLLIADALNILQNTIIKQPKLETIIYIDKLLKTYQRIEANGNIRLCLAQMVI